MESTLRPSEQPKKMQPLTAAQRSITYLRKLGCISLATLFTGAAITETAFQKRTHKTTSRQQANDASDAPTGQTESTLRSETVASSSHTISRTLTLNEETILIDCIYNGTEIIIHCEDTELKLHLSNNTYVPVIHNNVISSSPKEELLDEPVDDSCLETYSEQLTTPEMHTSGFFNTTWLRDRVKFIVQEVQSYGTEMAVNTLTANPDLIEQCPDTHALTADIGAAKVTIASEYLEQFLVELRSHKQTTPELIVFSIPIAVEIHDAAGGNTVYNCQLTAVGSSKPERAAHDSLKLIADARH